MRETVALVSTVGNATGARAAAAALACAGAGPDRASLLVDLTESRPRPSLISTAAAKALEERLAVHLPEARVAARGQTCHLSLPSDPSRLEAVAAALPLVRGSVGVVHLPPSLLQPLLEEPGICPSAALLRADLHEARALTALVCRDLANRGVRVAVLKRPLGWAASLRALSGVMPPGAAGGLHQRLRARLLGTAWAWP